MYTRCPNCETVYRVTPQQLQASSGQVRCGRCREVFDAFSTLSAQLPVSGVVSDDTFTATQTSRWAHVALREMSAAQPDVRTASSAPAAVQALPASPMPAAAPDAAPTAPARADEASKAAASSAPEESAPSAPEQIPSAPSERAVVTVTASNAPPATEGRPVAVGEARPQPRVEDDLSLPDALFEGTPEMSGRLRVWKLANAGLAALALGQVAWLFASAIANNVPPLREPLEAFCRWSGCFVALPRLPDQLFIEASDLQLLDAARPNEVVLTATIRNRAPVAQALPLLELTLTGAANQTAARKVFFPEQYLDRGMDAARGIGANQEIAIRLYLNTSEVQASGYRLYLFFA